MLIFGVTALYDSERDIVRFSAADEGRQIVMGISRAALLQLLNLPRPTADGLVAIYREFELDIQRIAARKYASRLFEPDGLILLKAEDVS